MICEVSSLERDSSRVSDCREADLSFLRAVSEASLSDLIDFVSCLRASDMMLDLLGGDVSSDATLMSGLFCTELCLGTTLAERSI